MGYCCIAQSFRASHGRRGHIPLPHPPPSCAPPPPPPPPLFLVEKDATIYTLYDQLLEVRQSSASNKANLLRSILAKTLCSHTKNKRQSAGKPNSTDFFRSITDFEARNIFGFNFYEWSHRRFPTLAFVVAQLAAWQMLLQG